MVPTGPRVLAGAGALTSGIYFGAAAPAGLLSQGYVLTGWTMVGVTVPLVAFLAAIALFPEQAQAGLRRVSRIDLSDPGHVAVTIIMAATIHFVLGYGSLVNGAFAYESEVVRGEEPAPIDGNALLVGVLLNLAILVLPPVLYVSFVGNKGPRGAFEALGVHARGAQRAIFIGCASALAVLVLLAVAGYAFQGFSIEVPENERALQIARSLTVAGAFALAVGSSVSEEVFFRGFLQPRIGLVGQAVFFALAHLSYVNVLEVVVTFVLALVFGIIYRMTGNLLAPIAGHFLFNLLMLLAGIYAPESA